MTKEHSFDFKREPPMFHDDGVIMVAWCFVHCEWEEWCQLDHNGRRIHRRRLPTHRPQDGEESA